MITAHVLSKHAAKMLAVLLIRGNSDNESSPMAWLSVTEGNVAVAVPVVWYVRDVFVVRIFTMAPSVGVSRLLPLFWLFWIHMSTTGI